MAVAAPSWKRKTRPCPFYSQGRCLFADSCNFIHSAKVHNDPSQSITDVFSSGNNYADEDDRPLRLPAGRVKDAGVKDAGLNENGDHSKEVSSRASRVFRNSFRSPPRSPRLSGLLFALEPVIGPDIEEPYDEDEELQETDDLYIDRQPQPADVSEDLSVEEKSFEEEASGSNELVGSPRSGFSKPHPEIRLHELSLDDEDQTSDPRPVLTPMDGSFNLTADGPGFSFLSDFPVPPSSLPLDSATAVTSTPKRSPSLQLQTSSPPASPDSLHIKDSSEYTLEAGSTMFDSHLTSDSFAPKSTFDLLSSPFASPVKRAFSPSIFPLSMPVSPVKKAMTLEATASHTSPFPGPLYLEGEVESLPGSLSGSPNSKSGVEEKAENSRTPRNSKFMEYNGIATDRTLPIPLSSLNKLNAVPRLPIGSEEDLTITAQSQYEDSFSNPATAGPSGVLSSAFDSYPSFEQFVEINRRSSASFSEDDDTASDSASPVSSTFRRMSSYDEHGTLGSVMDYYTDPSPTSSNIHSSDTSETLVELDARVVRLEKKESPSSKHGPVVEVSPFKESPVHQHPSSIETHRSSPNNREPPNSAPPVPSGSQMSWNEVSRRSAPSQKVPFGFRHSAILQQAQASSLSQASQTNRLSKVSDASTARPRLRVATKSPVFQSIENLSQRSRSMSPVVHANSRRPSWMRPLRLSQAPSMDVMLDSQPSSSSSHRSHFSNVSTSSQSQSIVVSPERHISNHSLSSTTTSIISIHDQDLTIPAHDISPLIMGPNGLHLRSRSSLYHSTTDNQPHSERASERGALELDLLSPLSGSMQGFDLDNDHPSRYDQPVGSPSPSLPTTRPASSLQVQAPPHAIATPRPTLMFAIASDDPSAVKQVLASGEVRPNDDIGPQSALEFALTNDALTQRTEIVKTLLAYGADPSSLPSGLRNALNGQEPSSRKDGSSDKRQRDSMNPAMKYYLNRARSPEAQRSTAAIRRSFFRPLTRIRFDFVGQDRALEQLYWVLNIHSKQPIASPLVVLCCGPSGYGKSLLARKFGSLLEVPTHTANMTTLKSAHDLWQCPSMSQYDEPSNRTLAEFLSENEGKRCIVVLDEIDKNDDERNLWSLLAPWELGRCPINGGKRHIDVRNVIWLGTSNIGQDQIFEYCDTHNEVAADTPLSREEYRELMALLRPRVSVKLGTSLMSRVTAVLPFVPFSYEEKMAIASEALLSLGADFAQDMSSEDFERFATRAVSDYVSVEGARSLYRSISNHLMEAF